MDENKIREFALENALKFNGKATQGAIVGKLMAFDSSVKQNMAQIMLIINKIISNVNLMSVEEQKAELLKLNPEFEKEQDDKKRANKEKSETLRELEDADKGVVMRFAPSPSGPMHIGHALTGGLTSVYVRKYNGKFILRIEDTNSDNIYPPAYELIPKDAMWVFGNVSEVWIQSDRMQIYYDYIVKLIELNAAYVCTCSQESFKELSDNMTDCPCRNLSIQDQKSRWEKMLTEFKEGDAVVRFKAGMQNKNPAMRDFPLARINESIHPRQGTKYKVWPLMNLSVTVDDIEAGMMHIIRASEHADNSKKQKMMFEVLNKPFPKTYFLGRYNFEGLELSTTKTRKKIEEGEYESWEDIRLPFLGSLRRRGIQPEAFLKFTEKVGISPVDKKIDVDEFFKSIYFLNTQLIEGKAKRFFFISDPVSITVKGAPKKEFELDMHPEKGLGKRKFKVDENYLVEKKDFDNFNLELIRLIDNINFKELEFLSENYSDFKDKGKQIIHFLPNDSTQLVKTKILMPNNNYVSGVSEKAIETLAVGEIVQFQRFGFARLDSIEADGTRIFWFSCD